MFSYLFCGLLAVAVTFVSPRVSMRLLKHFCPTFFSRLNCLITFGVKDALWAYDDYLWRQDGEPTELEVFPYLWKTTGVSAFIFALAALAIWNAGILAASFWLLVGACLPTFGIGFLLLGIGRLLLLLPGQTAAEREDELSDSLREGEPTKVVAVGTESIYDRFCDFLIDTWAAIQNLPSTVGYAGVDRFYDRAKKRLNERRSS